jgi:hypothetical protein
MDWEDNLEGVEKLLYPGDESEDDEDSEAEDEEEEMLLSDDGGLLGEADNVELALNDFIDVLDMNRLEYEAVRRSKLDSMKTIRADGMESVNRSAGSFVNTLDGRLYKTGIVTSLAEKATCTTSFNVETMECYGCNIDHARGIWRSKGDTRELSAEAFLLTDQSYPPLLPTQGEMSLQQ